MERLNGLMIMMKRIATMTLVLLAAQPEFQLRIEGRVLQYWLGQGTN
ncbi:MAG: hypothetical protein ABI963_03725 [Rhizomicrobium sp.]